MKQNIIFPHEWMQYRPYKVANNKDKYYANIATNIYKILDKSGIADVLGQTTNDLRMLSCYLTAWFVDLISEISIWRTFKLEYRKLYSKPLPFYEVDEEYADDDINTEDICFLLWHYMQQINGDRIINPENPGIIMTAAQISEYLFDEYEQAPDDNRVQEYLFPETDTLHFFDYRNRLNWFHFHSYLNIFNIHNLEDRLNEIIESNRSDSEKNVLAYATELELCLKAPNKMLALTSPEWLAKIIPEDHPFYSIYNNIKINSYALFLFKKEDEKYMYVVNYETREEIAITKESINTDSIGILESNESMLMMMLVYYNNEWWQCGMLSIFSKENKPEKKASNERERKKAYNDFMIGSKGKQFLYFSSEKELYTFIKKDMKYSVSGDLQLPEHVKSNIFITATPEDGIIVLSEGIECIKDPANPLYNKKTAEQDAIKFFVVPNLCPFEVLCILIDNKMLPDARLNSIRGEEHGKKLLNDNQDFFVRYFLGRHR